MKKAFLIAISIFLFACQSGKEAVLLNAEGFSKGISEANVQILDVRTPEEFAEGHIGRAVNIDINGKDFDNETETLYKELPVYVYCLKGSRSHTAAGRLMDLGFTQVYELEGGISSWLDAKMPVVKLEPPKIYESDTVPFLKAIEGNKLVLADFTATWCGPCRQMKPSIDKLHDERSDDVIVYSIDVDEHPDLAREYEAKAIPLLLLFKDGKIVHRSEGALQYSVLNNLIDVNK